MGAFEDFVNIELPKRISTEVPFNGNLPAGKVLKTTGVGLFVEAQDEFSYLIETGTAGENLSRYKVLYLDNNLLYTSSTNINIDKVVGISLNSAVLNSQIKYIYVGSISDPTFGTFNNGDKLFMDVNGNITNVPPINNWCLPIGVCRGDNNIFVNINTSEAIWRN